MQTIVAGRTLIVSALFLVLIVTLALGLVSIAYGQPVAAAHDLFHDFRHAIGMPCH